MRKLACVSCRNPSLQQRQDELFCSDCGKKFSVVNNIPDFLSSFCLGDLSGWEENSPWNADTFESNISSHTEPFRLRRIDEPILKYVKGDVLEIGCGTCRLAAPVEKHGGSYFGLDPVFPFLLYAQKRLSLQRLVRGQGERLPFQNESFDSIISGYYAYRFVNPGPGLSEARRVLKRGGKFAFDLLNFWCLKYIELRRLIAQRDYRNLRSFLRLHPQPGCFEFISLSQLKQKAEKAGFLVEKVISTPLIPFCSELNKRLSNFYYRGKMIYLGYDVIVVLKAVG